MFCFLLRNILLKKEKIYMLIWLVLFKKNKVTTINSMLVKKTFFYEKFDAFIKKFSR